MQKSREEYYQALENSPFFFEVLDGKMGAKVRADDNFEFTLGFADWTTFNTLTFRNPTHPELAYKYFRKLIRTLNETVFGGRYRDLVGHSYFSYALGVEYQKRDVIHFHFLADRPIHFKMIHMQWNQIAGFALPKIAKSKEEVSRYICKYNIKGGDVLFYKAKKKFYPPIKFTWWAEQS